MLGLLVTYGRRSRIGKSLAASAWPVAQALICSTAARCAWQHGSAPRQLLHCNPIHHAIPLATVSNGMAASAPAGTGADAVAVYVTVPDLKLGTTILGTFNVVLHAVGGGNGAQLLILFCGIGGVDRNCFTGAGKEIAHHIVKQRLAACCNIIPGLTSVYEWEETVCEDQELLLMIKTTQQRVAELTLAVQQLHTYEECEVIAVRLRSLKNQDLGTASFDALACLLWLLGACNVSLARQQS